MAGAGYAGPGFNPPKPPVFHRFVGKALGATMWFWIFYRGRQDLPHLLGWEHPWDHHHGNGHGEEHH